MTVDLGKDVLPLRAQRQETYKMHVIGQGSILVQPLAGRLHQLAKLCVGLWVIVEDQDVITATYQLDETETTGQTEKERYMVCVATV